MLVICAHVLNEIQTACMRRDVIVPGSCVAAPQAWVCMPMHAQITISSDYDHGIHNQN